MIAPPTPQQLALLHDEELAQLASLWRTQAARGVRAAFGLAHALEVESRRRARLRQHQHQLEHQPDPPAPAASTSPAPWWKTCWTRVQQSMAPPASHGMS
jgi:hypothetical protein